MHRPEINKPETPGTYKIDKPETPGNKTEITVNRRYLQYKEPLSYKQALTFTDKHEWVEATNKELQQFADLKR